MAEFSFLKQSADEKTISSAKLVKVLKYLYDKSDKSKGTIDIF